ncbi:MAG TPA: 50S ribosomal protein L13 [Candidatus Sulfotelmatobacter sp.]|jgi:large subunit ribosomal protein L13|nr:50S ribosomal protein L13 [Candidatus Sulfotelmatobacter sp.]
MNQAITAATKASDIKRAWHLIDVKGKTLGRVSSEIAQLLMGKGKAYFVRNLDCGDYVVIVNAKEVKVTGNKEEQKNYYRHSGYPGGFKVETLKELRERKPENIITHAVKGMLPGNRLRDRMLTRLFVFEGTEHTYTDKFNN